MFVATWRVYFCQSGVSKSALDLGRVKTAFPGNSISGRDRSHQRQLIASPPLTVKMKPIDLPRPKRGSGRTGPTTSLSLLVPENDGSGSFVKTVEDHFRDRFSVGDRTRDPDTTGEDETQREGVDTTGDPPTDCLDDRAKMGISHSNEHRFLALPAST